MTALEVADWRRGRDDLFATHPSSPLQPRDRDVFTGLPVRPYDPGRRFEVRVEPADPRRIEVETGTDGIVPFQLFGVVDVPGVGTLDVWRPGSEPKSLVLDFNFAYNPSCAYDPAWACPLAQPGNTVDASIPVGERYSGDY